MQGWSMTQSMILTAPTQPRGEAPPRRSITGRVSRKAAENAYAAFFGKTASGVPLDTEQRKAMSEAIVDYVAVGNNQALPRWIGRSDHLLVLVEGWAHRARTLLNGTLQITDILLPGDVFDWNIADVDDPADEIRACGSSCVAALCSRVSVEQGPVALRHALDWCRHDEVQRLRERLVSVGRRDARARIAHLLAELHHRLRRVGLVEGDTFRCPMKQEQLADAVGLTSVHVNRVLRSLSQDGLVTISRPNVVIHDLARLHEEAGRDGQSFN